jgi:hypothetical protein
MPERIALMVSISPQPDLLSGVLRLTNVYSDQPLPVPALHFLLTLESEPDGRIARGHLRTLQGDVSHPIQSSIGLFQALSRFLGSDGVAR